jgi:hypothetical protein
VRLSLAEQFASVDELLNRVNGGATVTSPAQKKKPEIGRAEGGGQRAEAPSHQPAVATKQIDDDDALPAVGKVWEADSGPSLSELLKQEEAQPVQTTTSRPTSNVEPVNPHDLPQVWQRLLDALEQKGPSLPALLSGAKLVGIDAGQVTVSYPANEQARVRILERNGKKDTIRDVLSGLLSQNVGLRFEFEQTPAAGVAVPDAPPRATQRTPVHPVRREVQYAAPAPEPTVRITDELRRELASDELIKAVIDNLGGEIVKVE